MDRVDHNKFHQSGANSRAAFRNVRHVAKFLDNSPKNLDEFVSRIELTR
jgi:hypothetical protein